MVQKIKNKNKTCGPKNKHTEEKSYPGRICKQEIDGKPEEKWDQIEKNLKKMPKIIMKKDNEEMVPDLACKLLSCFYNTVIDYYINYGGK